MPTVYLPTAYLPEQLQEFYNMADCYVYFIFFIEKQSILINAIQATKAILYNGLKGKNDFDRSGKMVQDIAVIRWTNM